MDSNDNVLEFSPDLRKQHAQVLPSVETFLQSVDHLVATLKEEFGLTDRHAAKLTKRFHRFAQKHSRDPNPAETWEAFVMKQIEELQHG